MQQWVTRFRLKQETLVEMSGTRKQYSSLTAETTQLLYVTWQQSNCQRHPTVSLDRTCECPIPVDTWSRHLLVTNYLLIESWNCSKIFWYKSILLGLGIVLFPRSVNHSHGLKLQSGNIVAALPKKLYIIYVSRWATKISLTWPCLDWPEQYTWGLFWML